jgi:hypothetical protein
LRREPHCDLNCDNGLWAPGVRPTMCIEIFRAAYHLRGKLNTLFFHKLQFVLVCSKLSEFFTSCHHYFCTYRRNWARHLPNRNQGLRPERDGTRATGSHLPDCAFTFTIYAKIISFSDTHSKMTSHHSLRSPDPVTRSTCLPTGITPSWLNRSDRAARAHYAPHDA